MQGLTKRQREILDFIEEYSNKKRHSPSYREIQAHFGFHSIASVYNHIQALKRKEALAPQTQRARSLHLPSLVHPSEETIPLVGTLRAGMPVTTFAQITSLPFPKHLLASKDLIPGKCYFLRVVGKELEEEAIQEGDLLLVEAREDFEERQMVLAEVGGTTTCVKRASTEPPYIRLESENRHLQPMIVREDHLQILGVVHLVLRSY